VGDQVGSDSVRDCGGIVNELWVARSRDDTRLFKGQPQIVTAYGLWKDDRAFQGWKYGHHVPDDLFPDLKPGECRRLVLAEETSE
jgi:hypothetical protein